MAYHKRHYVLWSLLKKSLIQLKFDYYQEINSCIDDDIWFISFQYAGLWYEAYRHDVNEVDTKCENGTYTVGVNGTMNVTSQGLNQLTGYYTHHGIAKPKSSSEPASFLIHYTQPSNTFR